MKPKKDLSKFPKTARDSAVFYPDLIGEEKVKKSSGNLYADLGCKNTEEMEAKASLARTIYRLIKQRKLSQVKAAELLGIPQPTLCRLLQGNLTGFSTDRLLKFLNQLANKRLLIF